jgi:hypothetical protein
MANGKINLADKLATFSEHYRRALSARSMGTT